jgi:hypothetical protein
MGKNVIEITWSNAEETWRKERLEILKQLLHYRLPLMLLFKITRLHDQKGTLNVHCTPLLKSELDDIGSVVQQLWEHAFVEGKYIINLPTNDTNH